MCVFIPKYYLDFQCIADQCKHNCCIGWEIDIDNETYEKYKNSDSALRTQFDKYIADTNPPHFILDGNERCPFLNQDNLCNIILSLGKDYLCEICRMHPRFINSYSHFSEYGIGMCCGEACRIILSNTKKFELITLDCDNYVKLSDEENVFFNFRNKMFEILQNREKTLNYRVRELLYEFDIKFPSKSISEWVKIYIELENLEPKWKDLLKGLSNAHTLSIDKSLDIIFEQILIYFIYRHLSGALIDGMFTERILFSILSTYMIYSLSALLNHPTLDDIAEISRQYSVEVEYSDKNLDVLLGLLSV